MKDTRYNRLYNSLSDYYSDWPDTPIGKKTCLEIVQDQLFDHGYTPRALEEAVERFVYQWRSMDR